MSGEFSSVKYYNSHRHKWSRTYELVPHSNNCTQSVYLLIFNSTFYDRGGTFPSRSGRGLGVAVRRIFGRCAKIELACMPGTMVTEDLGGKRHEVLFKVFTLRTLVTWLAVAVDAGFALTADTRFWLFFNTDLNWLRMYSNRWLLIRTVLPDFLALKVDTMSGLGYVAYNLMLFTSGNVGISTTTGTFKDSITLRDTTTG